MKKTILLLLVVFMIISVASIFTLSGCKKEAVQETAAETTAAETTAAEITEVETTEAEKITLQLWSHDYKPLVDQYNMMIERYESENPNITIEYTAFPWNDFEPTLVTKLAAGAGPDVFGCWDVWFAGLLNKGVLNPVNYGAMGYSSKEDLENDVVENSLSICSTEDEIYGIIIELNSYCLFINNKYFEEVGLNPETDYPKTWDELIEVAKKLVILDKKGNFVREGFDLNTESPTQEAFMSSIFYAQAGAKWFNDDNTECLLNSPEAIKGMEMISSLINEHKVGSPKSGNADPLLHAVDFLEGQLSMMINNPTIEALAQEKFGDDFTVVEVPHMKDGSRATSGYGWFWAVNEASKYQEESWKFIDFLSSDPVSWYDNLKFYQTRNPEWMDSPEAEAIKSKFFDVWVEGFKIMSAPPQIEIYNDVFNANSKAYESVLFDNANVTDVLNQAKVEIDSALERMAK